MWVKWQKCSFIFWNCLHCITIVTALEVYCIEVCFVFKTFWSYLIAVQHERGPRTSTIRKQVALYFRGHKEVNGTSTHFSGSSLAGPPFFTTVTQLEPHNLEISSVTTTPERQAMVGLAQPTPKVHTIMWILCIL